MPIQFITGPIIPLKISVLIPADIIGNGHAEKFALLQRVGDRISQSRKVVIFNIDTVNQDPPSVHVIEPVYQTGQGALAGTGAADYRHSFTGLDREIYSLEGI